MCWLYVVRGAIGKVSVKVESHNHDFIAYKAATRTTNWVFARYVVCGVLWCVWWGGVVLSS